MILLADVGASTAKIVYLGSIFSEGKSARIVNKGFNPTYHTEEEICERISQWPIPNGTIHDIHSVIIYGAGCMRLDRAQKVSRSLKIHFSNASIKVYSDLLAPIHANENHKGYYAILGTGSVCCHFDGQSIHLLRPSLGFLINDTGSGFHIGKTFLTRLLSGDIVHKPLTLKIQEQWGSPLQQVDWVSIENDPIFQSRVASLTKIVATYQGDEGIRSILFECFELWVSDLVKHGQDPIKKIHLSGSVGFHFKEVIHKVLSAKGIQIGQCIASPMTVLEKRLNIA
ncbi:MAG: hypothetical protein CMN34_00070 [Saprospirales bacterium]|nr:hypothetical protein [Saprospirales bacterium]|tara:strand:- start:6202 stop:7053 length:852 start_codon:yes stop_codon:yes gene_type:complete